MINIHHYYVCSIACNKLSITNVRRYKFYGKFIIWYGTESVISKKEWHKNIFMGTDNHNLSQNSVFNVFITPILDSDDGRIRFSRNVGCNTTTQRETIKIGSAFTINHRETLEWFTHAQKSKLLLHKTLRSAALVELLGVFSPDAAAAEAAKISLQRHIFLLWRHTRMITFSRKMRFAFVDIRS